MRAERWYEVLWGWLTHLHIRLAYRLIWLGARLGHGTSRSVYQAMWDAYLDLPRLRSDRLQQGALTPFGEIDAKYHELIFAVGNKYEGESRHETALRYIRDHEAQAMSTGTAKTPKAVEGEARQPGPSEKDAPND